MGKKYTHIRLTIDTVKELKALGRKDETYEDIIRRLIEAWKIKTEEKK